jgi:hypothetical protein
MTAPLEASVVPVVAVCDLKALPLGRVEAFVLSQVDGRSSLEDLASMTALSMSVVRRILHHLHDLGAIDLPGQPRRRPSKRTPAVGPGGSVRPGRRSGARRFDLAEPVFSPSVVPERIGKQAPATGTQLGAKEGFVLSQIDGATSVADLASITGFDLGALTEMLGKLAHAGVIEPKKAPTPGGPASGARAREPAPAAIPPPPPPRSSVHSRRPSVRVRTAEPPKEPDKPAPPPDSKGGSGPVLPARAPPPAAADDAGHELDAETSARIDELYAKLAAANLYEMLGVPRDADKKAVKSAFFAFAATLHPDRHFRKKLGPYKQKINDVFVRLTFAYETLGSATKRAEYDKRLPAAKRVSAAPQHTARVSMQPRTSGRPRAPSGSPAPVSVAERREVLAARLGDARPSAPSAAPVDPAVALRQFFDERVERSEKGRRQRARVFVDAAEEALAKDDFVAAATHYKLALECCEAPELRAAFEAVDVKARARRFEIHLKAAEQAERDQRWEEAASRYAKAHAALPEPRVAERLANALRLQGGDARRAVRHAEEAVLAEPTNGAYRLTLAEACAAAGLGLRARAEAERALSMMPKDARAKELLAKLARSKP